jgi:hypothetical protein
MRRASLLVLALLAAAGCDDAAHMTATAGPVQGAPLRAPKTARVPASVPADVAAIGDVDTVPPGETSADPLPPIVPPPAKPAETKPAAAAPSVPAAADGEFEEVDFDLLASFECASYASTERPPVPEKILALSGKKVTVTGYMMPLSHEAGGAKKFLIMRYKFGCCYAVTPKINEWIEVTMEKGVADYAPDTLDTVWGVLEVKEELRDGGAVGLYKILASKSEFTEAR